MVETIVCRKIYDTNLRTTFYRMTEQSQITNSYKLPNTCAHAQEGTEKETYIMGV